MRGTERRGSVLNPPSPISDSATSFLNSSHDLGNEGLKRLQAIGENKILSLDSSLSWYGSFSADETNKNSFPCAQKQIFSDPRIRLATSV